MRQRNNKPIKVSKITQSFSNLNEVQLTFLTDGMGTKMSHSTKVLKIGCGRGSWRRGTFGSVGDTKPPTKQHNQFT